MFKDKYTFRLFGLVILLIDTCLGKLFKHCHDAGKKRKRLVYKIYTQAHSY